MISAVHTLIYSDDPAATRAFLRDVLQLRFVNDGGEGDDPQDWLIFETGPSEVGVHPTEGEYRGEAFRAPTHHQMSLLVDDMAATAEAIRQRGGLLQGPPKDLGFGIGVEVDVPGTDPILIYQPNHRTIAMPPQD